jgi:hypothetical protein
MCPLEHVSLLATQALDAARKASESAARRLGQISSEIGDDRPIQVRESQVSTLLLGSGFDAEQQGWNTKRGAECHTHVC